MKNKHRKINVRGGTFGLPLPFAHVCFTYGKSSFPLRYFILQLLGTSYMFILLCNLIPKFKVWCGFNMSFFRCHYKLPVFGALDWTYSYKCSVNLTFFSFFALVLLHVSYRMLLQPYLHLSGKLLPG